MSWGYYAYVIGGDGHVQNRIEVLCGNDDEAKRCAEKLADGHAVELWQEARRIAIFQARQQDISVATLSLGKVAE
ncbi:MAG: hypothetical protein ACREEK_33760 [Bradyrhizobium sp.]